MTFQKASLSLSSLQEGALLVWLPCPLLSLMHLSCRLHLLPAAHMANSLLLLCRHHHQRQDRCPLVSCLHRRVLRKSSVPCRLHQTPTLPPQDNRHLPQHCLHHKLLHSAVVLRLTTLPLMRLQPAQLATVTHQHLVHSLRLRSVACHRHVTLLHNLDPTVLRHLRHTHPQLQHTVHDHR
jgi:hypothetical protein